MAVEEGKPTDLPIHIRGSHLSLGEIMPRGFPQALGGQRLVRADQSSGRLELADWVADAKNPLTARVMVNRLWHWHFGAGLVRSADNFGNLGDRPSHPELLDWLAARFIESGWSVKAMHRLIMLSATYQTATTYNPAAAVADPDNRLLWRMNRRRLEAEAVRDALLFVAGSIDTSLGGTLLEAKPRAYVTSTASVNATNYATNRRSVYLPVVPETDRAIRFVDRYTSASAAGAAAGNSADAAPANETAGQPTAWQALSRVLLSSNEFLYVE
jgi:hypothetical protein